VRIRRLESGDVALAVAALRSIKETARDDLGDVVLRRFLARLENVLIVADEDGTPAGYLVAYFLDRVDRPRSMACLYEIGVAAGHRRRGIGRALIEELQRICREARVMKVWVVASRANEAAIRLYAGTGGREAGVDDVVFVYQTPD
jgi:ribosomal protein S18 acetylase RimI-like enzyme